MVIRDRIEANTPPDVIKGLVDVAGDDVLIGGQALAIWVQLYNIEVPDTMATVSRDVDFLTTSVTSKSSLYRYADVLKGQAHVYSSEIMTSLVGQAYKELPDNKYLNVDVLWTMTGIDPESVRTNAVHITFNESSFFVMSPMDVLRSRMINLHKIPEKGTEAGIMQLKLAVGVMREHLRGKATEYTAEELSTGRSPLQTMVSAIEKLAIDDAGRKIAKRFGVHVADAIDPSLIPAGPFWVKKWPKLKNLMSVDYANRFAVPVSPGENELATQWNAEPGQLQATGCIVALSETEIIQDVGRGKYTVWNRRQLQDATLRVGESVTIHESGRVDRTVIDKCNGL